MLPILRKLLNACHVTKNMPLLKMLIDANEQYCLKRAEEAITHIFLDSDAEKNYVLAIQLLNLAHYKYLEKQKLKSNLFEELEDKGYPKP